MQNIRILLSPYIVLSVQTFPHSPSNTLTTAESRTPHSQQIRNAMYRMLWYLPIKHIWNEKSEEEIVTNAQGMRWANLDCYQIYIWIDHLEFAYLAIFLFVFTMVFYSGKDSKSSHLIRTYVLAWNENETCLELFSGGKNVLICPRGTFVV